MVVGSCEERKENYGRCLRLTELGEKLKQARQQKGISLDELQQITKIQKRYLVAIEEGNFSVMPGKFYARAFIKQYAEAVDLNSAELFAEFEQEVPETPTDQVEEVSRATQKRATLASRQVGAANNRRNRFLDVLPKILIAVFIIFILFVVWLFLFHRTGDSTQTVKDKSAEQKIQVQNNTDESDNKTSKSTTKKTTKETSDKEKNTKTEKAKEKTKKEVTVDKGTTQGNSTTFTVKNADKLSLSLSASNAQSWISVTGEDGSSLFTKTLTAGQSETVDAKDNQTVKITIGNATATTLKINGKTAELPTDSVKQIVTVQLEKDE